MKISSYKQKIIQKSFALKKKPIVVEADVKALESWGSNFSRFENTWRSACLNRGGNLDQLKRDFFRASFDLKQQLRQHSNLPHETVLILEKRLEALANEVRSMQ